MFKSSGNDNGMMIIRPRAFVLLGNIFLLARSSLVGFWVLLGLHDEVLTGQPYEHPVRVKFMAVILKGAIHDDFAGGASKSYDLTQIEIIEPGKYSGQKLNVVHPSGTHLEPMWTTVGAKCVVEIGSWLLGDPDILIPTDSIKMTCARSK